MTSLAELIQSFRKGALSHDAFFAQIDRTLALDHVNCERLREALDETQTKDPLPDDIYAELIRHIERFASAHASLSDETRVQVAPPPAVRHAAPGRTPGEPSEDEHARVKGIGDTLNGRFVLEECLGVGGMGTVYKALDLRKLEAADRKPYIAIKVLNVQFRGQPTSLIALQREARKAQTLAHRNIVTVYDFDRDGPMVYITMEYLSGSPLSKLLRAPDFTGMPYEKALPIIAGMGRALAYAHERGFVHCDFKPANVFLTDAGEVKVIDFGIARALTRSDDESDVTVFDPATLGGITPAYASPEMFEHREPDPRDDVYALGCVTYELLTGRHPFNRMSAIQARGEKMQPERPSNLDRRQWRTLAEALSLDRATRTPSVERFLEGMGAQMHAPPSPPRAPRPPQHPEQSRPARHGVGVSRAVWKGAGVAVVALIAAAALWYGYREWPGASSRPNASSSAGTGTIRPQTPASAETPSPASTSTAPPDVSTPPAPLSLAAVLPVLAAQPCAALSASIDGAALRVHGYVEERAGVARLRDALAPLVGSQALSLDVQPVSEHNCDVVSAFAPYWASTHQAGSAATGTSIRTKAPNGQLTEGSPLVLDVTTPGYDSYVNVDYYVLDGSVVHLVPSRRAKDNQAPPHYTATIGGMGDWVIGRPFGTEMIALVVTPAPLFDSLRPDAEPRASHLAAVKERLKQIAAKYGSAHIGVDFAQITTRAGQR
ncbi:MAG TPA: protein kinase [Trinickia sp.]|nr:protein kinase [Trinickia sp.]